MPLTSSFAVLQAPSAQSSISLSEVISALSFALDLTEGAVPGHALRSCLLGMRIAAAAGVPVEQRASLYYALLLKDTGCSSNAARMSQIVGGDASIAGAEAEFEDWGKQPRQNAYKPRLTALRTLLAGLKRERSNTEMISLRCQRAANILNKLGMGELAAEAVRHLDEHWDGGGYPGGIKGERIPLLSRICAIAQHLDVFSTERGVAEAIAVLLERSGTWFDPELVKVTVSLHRERMLWMDCLTGDNIEDTRQTVLDLDPARGQQVESSRIDRICEAFADVVDAKSPFTFRHSVGVADTAYDIAREMGLAPARIQLVRRAALLHDIGKLGISNSIIDKPSSLTVRERMLVEEHPKLTRRILERVSAFSELAVIAGEHHEKLDGSGYPNRLVAKDLSIESRIVAVSDVFGALHEDRPYRKGLEMEQIVSIMQALAPRQLDQDCMSALFSVLEQGKQPNILHLVPSRPSHFVPQPVAAAKYVTAHSL